MMRWKAQLITATGAAALALVGCTQGVTLPGGAAAQTAPKSAVVAHATGLQHTAQPKRLDVVAEIDMGEFSFSAPGVQGRPVIKVPSGKTVGLHLHNEGAVMHEIVIGRKPVQMVEKVVSGTKVSVPDGYAKALFEDLEADVFFYYSDTIKAEVGGAKFGEIEMDAGLRDVWLRVKFPPEARGEWEIGCFAEGHYEAGMYATLIVE
ncbi:MAG: hypothetical protein EPO26_13855 [Chloroflexota bacterium]|nr:MAG: hypothetical protein EPO26_13855 [Chloroflexota bacterium]